MRHKLLEEIQKGSKNALMKKRIISYYIYNGSSTITDLAKELDLSIPTVTKFITEMGEENLIRDYGKLETSGGRHPNLYGLNPESGYFIGIEVLKQVVNIGLINFKGDVVEMKMAIPYESNDHQASVGLLSDIILNFIDNIQVDKNNILNIHINIPGRVNPKLGYSYGSYSLNETKVAEELADAIDYNVTIDNDTRAMAFGEFMQGDVKDQRDIIFVNISWGLGIGIIIDGKLYTGKSGFSGEFGHVSVYDNEILCHCGKKGCLETEASGRALHRILLDRINNGETSILSSKVAEGSEITLDDIITATLHEDMLCIEIIEEIGEKLGKQIAGLINIFNPELVIVGGSLSLTGDYITQPIQTAVRKFSLNLVSRDSKIKTSKLKDKAGVIGSCMMARSKIFDLNN